MFLICFCIIKVLVKNTFKIFRWNPYSNKSEKTERVIFIWTTLLKKLISTKAKKDKTADKNTSTKTCYNIF